MIEVRYERGVYLAQQGLWLDPWDAKPFAFISHAHSDHIAPHEEIIVSERTARLLKSRLPGRRVEHILPFGEKRTVQGLDLLLLPAGHIFGSAQFFLFLSDETLLYTGDFKLRPGKSAEQVQWREADTLIMETTFGLSHYRFPPTHDVVDQIVSFCRATIEAGEVPVLLGYSLGKAQEILCSLDGAGLTPMLHGSVYEMTRIYEQFGQSFCKYTRYRLIHVRKSRVPPNQRKIGFTNSPPIPDPNSWRSRKLVKRSPRFRQSWRKFGSFLTIFVSLPANNCQS